MRPQAVLISGGARSGKSAYALELGEALGTNRILVATAQALDEEMRTRITRHREERGERFVTIEEPRDLVGALSTMEAKSVVIVDCITLWISNLILSDETDAQIQSRVEALLQLVTNAHFHSILVTNEVGMGVVPQSALGRRFRDLAGHTNQVLARAADRVLVAMLGCIIQLKPIFQTVERS